MHLKNSLRLCLVLACMTSICVMLTSLLYLKKTVPLAARQVKTRDDVPESLKGLIASVDDLKGRHSDYLTSECKRQEPGVAKRLNSTYGFVGPFNYLPDYKNPCWRAEGNTTVHCVPYFYLVGCPKSGTSDLYNRLSQHPDILAGNSKEVRWFDWYRFTDPVKFSFQYFLNFYAKGSSRVQSSVTRNGYHTKIIADGSPHTAFRNSFWQLIPENEGCSEPMVTPLSQIHHLWPKTKIIFILRNPVNRLFSAYLYNYLETGANRTAAQFHEWTVAATEKWQDCLRLHSFRFCLYDDKVRTMGVGALPFGMYSRILLDALRVFPRTQIYVVQTEEWNKDMGDILQKVFQFLNLDPIPERHLQAITKKRKINVGNGYEISGEMWSKTRQLLTDFYTPYNRELADILGDNKFLWRD